MSSVNARLPSFIFFSSAMNSPYCLRFSSIALSPRKIGWFSLMPSRMADNRPSTSVYMPPSVPDSNSRSISGI